MNTLDFTLDNGKTLKARLIRKGDKYGLNDRLTHADWEPMVEFFHGKYFISRYYVTTFMATQSGLCLDSNARQYDLGPEAVSEVKAWLKTQGI